MMANLLVNHWPTKWSYIMTNLELAVICRLVYMEMISCMPANGHRSLAAQHQVAVHHGLTCNKAKTIWRVIAIGRSFGYYVNNQEDEVFVLLIAELADIGWTYKSFF